VHFDEESDLLLDSWLQIFPPCYYNFQIDKLALDSSIIKLAVMRRHKYKK